MTGSSTEDYNTNEGVQPKAIKRMVDRLTSPKNSTIFSENDIDSSFDYTASTYFLS